MIVYITAKPKGGLLGRSQGVISSNCGFGGINHFTPSEKELAGRKHPIKAFCTNERCIGRGPKLYKVRGPGLGVLVDSAKFIKAGHCPKCTSALFFSRHYQYISESSDINSYRLQEHARRLSGLPSVLIPTAFDRNTQTILQQEYETMSLFDEGTKKADTVGQFNSHPLGRFAAVITKVQAGTWAENRFFEIHLTTAEGTAKHTVWENLESQIPSRVAKLGTMEAARKAYVDSVARTQHLYVVTGMDKAESEAAMYQRLGALVAKQVCMVVKNNPKDSRNPYINLYPIAELEGPLATPVTANGNGNGGTDWTGQQEAPPAAEAGDPGPLAGAPDLSEVPF